MTTMLPKRIEAKIIPEPTSTIWLWTAATVNGYGRVSHNGRSSALAHRVVYEIIKGPVPVGFQLDHLYRVPCCVNPDHMEPVTHAENVWRGSSGNRERDRTHCPRGHPYSPENTRVTKQGWRNCRVCEREVYQLRHKAKRASEKPESDERRNRIEAACRALCHLRNTGRCAALCMQHNSTNTEAGHCPEAVTVWQRAAVRLAETG